MAKKNEGFTIDKITPEVIEEFKKEYDFDYIRKNFYIQNYKPYDLQKDILEIANYNQDLSQISSIGPTTTRVTNYYVTETQCKASSVSAICDPDTAVHDDVYLTKMLHRLKTSPHFFSRRRVALEQLRKEGLTEEILTRDTSDYTPIQMESYKALRQHYIDTINLADLREVRNAISHIPSFHKVSQFPNHAAQKIYERYCPKEHGIILDSSCVDADTEYFNGLEWKKIKDYTEGEYVLQYDLGHTATLVKPLRYLHYKDKSKPFYHFKSYNTDQMLTGDHNVVSVNRLNDTARLDYSKIYKTPVEEYIKSSYPLNRTRIPTTVGSLSKIDESKFNLTEMQLRFIIACQADAHITKPYFTTSNKQYFSTNPLYEVGTERHYKSYAKFSKKHKIERFQWLLDELNIPYSVGKYSYPDPKHNDQTVFEFVAPDFLYNTLNDSKDFPQEWLYTMNQDMREIFIDEIFKWDATDNNTYINTNKHNAEFVYTLLLTSDIMPKIRIEDKTNIKGKEHYKICYYVTAQKTKSCGLLDNKHSYSIDYKEDKYCFTVPSGMLVLRRNGIPFITGNCGWGNRLMATMSSKYHYKYLGTDPNSEMHNNYRGIADLMYKVIYRETDTRKYPEEFFDMRDQGSEFDIPEWHNNSGYIINEEDNTITNKFTNKTYPLNSKLQCPQFIKDDEEDIPTGEHITYHWEHPNKEGYGINDTGKYHTSGSKLPPIYNTHDEEIFNSGIGDLSFTSPPYFFLETYTQKSHSGDTSDGQSAGKKSLYTDWLTNFVYPTVVNHFNYLKPGGYYVFNLKDLPKYGFYIYSDWLSICLDVGFELIEQPELILKSRRHVGKTDDGSSNRILEDEKFKAATEKIAVLRKPLHPTDPSITNQSKDALYHIQNNFQYNLLKRCRPQDFTSKLPDVVQDYLENYKYNKDFQYTQQEISEDDQPDLNQDDEE